MLDSNDRKRKMKLWQTQQINTKTGVKTSGVFMSADSCSIITTSNTGRSQQSNKGHNESDSQGETHS